jgi:CDGSH-type Zn-finger protein
MSIKIEVTENGPYKLEGATKLQTVKGELDALSTSHLCRCGESGNKPFCDGTHNSVGFSGKKEADRVEDRLDEYKGKEITIYDNRGICAHGGYCTGGSPDTFGEKENGFADPDAESKELIQETIHKCPSGALNYHSGSGSKDHSKTLSPSIFVATNGPYVLKNVKLSNEKWLEGADQNRFALCRCGKSKNKPFCSGAHWYHHFDESTEPSEWAKTKSDRIKD